MSWELFLLPNMDNQLSLYQPQSESVVIYHSEDEAVELEVQLSDETVWLTQKQMAWLFDTSSQNITIHINNVYKEKELVKNATCKDFLQVQKEGGRNIQRKVKHYNLDVIISVGYRVKSQRTRMTASFALTTRFTISARR